MTVSSVYIKN